jgi:hypothetical protein
VDRLELNSFKDILFIAATLLDLIHYNPWMRKTIRGLILTMEDLMTNIIFVYGIRVFNAFYALYKDYPPVSPSSTEKFWSMSLLKTSTH